MNVFYVGYYFELCINFKKTTYFLSSFICSSALFDMMHAHIIKRMVNIINNNKIINREIVNKFISITYYYFSFLFCFYSSIYVV